MSADRHVDDSALGDTVNDETLDESRFDTPEGSDDNADAAGGDDTLEPEPLHEPDPLGPPPLQPVVPAPVVPAPVVPAPAPAPQPDPVPAPAPVPVVPAPAPAPQPDPVPAPAPVPVPAPAQPVVPPPQPVMADNMTDVVREPLFKGTEGPAIARSFLKRVEASRDNKNWDQKQTAAHMCRLLTSEAEEWLLSLEDQHPTAREDFAVLRPLFVGAFGVADTWSEKKKLLDQMQQTADESPQRFLVRVTNNVSEIFDKFSDIDKGLQHSDNVTIAAAAQAVRDAVKAETRKMHLRYKESSIFTFFMLGLRDDLAAVVIRQDPKDLASALNMAKNAVSGEARATSAAVAAAGASGGRQQPQTGGQQPQQQQTSKKKKQPRVQHPYVPVGQPIPPHPGGDVQWCDLHRRYVKHSTAQCSFNNPDKQNKQSSNQRSYSNAASGGARPRFVAPINYNFQQQNQPAAPPPPQQVAPPPPPQSAPPSTYSSAPPQQGYSSYSWAAENQQ